MRLHVSIAASLLLAVAACGSNENDSGNDPITGDDVDAGTPEPGPPDGGVQPNQCDGVTLEVGTGNREYTAVAPGDTVYLFRGPQGGYMFYISVRAKGIDPSNARLCYKDIVTTGGEKNVGEGCWSIQLPIDLGGGMHERVGVWGQIDPAYWTTPGQIRDKDVRVEVTLSDTKGCSAQGGWSAHVSPDAPK